MSWKARIKDVIMAVNNHTGTSLPAIKKALGCDRSQWRFVNAALRSGLSDGTFVKNGGKFKVANNASSSSSPAAASAASGSGASGASSSPSPASYSSLNWQEQEQGVFNWLKGLRPGVGLERYHAKFIAEGADSTEAVTYIQKSDLESFGIKSIHLRWIWEGVQTLAQNKLKFRVFPERVYKYEPGYCNSVAPANLGDGSFHVALKVREVILKVITLSTSASRSKAVHA